MARIRYVGGKKFILPDREVDQTKDTTVISTKEALPTVVGKRRRKRDEPSRED